MWAETGEVGCGGEWVRRGSVVEGTEGTEGMHSSSLL